MSDSRLPVARKRAWTPEEDEKIRAMYPATKLDKIAEMLNRSLSSVRHRTINLGIYRPYVAPDLVEFRRAYDEGLNDRAIAKRYGWSSWGVRNARISLGLEPNSSKGLRTIPWTPERHAAKNAARRIKERSAREAKRECEQQNEGAERNNVFSTTGERFYWRT